jgi:hypothetical protein
MLVSFFLILPLTFFLLRWQHVLAVTISACCSQSSFLRLLHKPSDGDMAEFRVADTIKASR